MSYSSATLDEQLPLECDACGFTFSRTLDEFFKLGRFRCPQCFKEIILDKAEVEEIANAIEVLHSLERDLHDD